MAKKRITDIVDEILAPFFESEGYCLYHKEFVKEGKDWFLRVYIERKPEKDETWPQNVNTDDCEKVSKFLSRELDLLDPIDKNYYLEVSSPGIERPLIKEEDFLRYKGHLVDIRLYKSIDGKKTITGKLVDSTEDCIKVEDQAGKTIDLHKEKISRARLAIDF